MKNYWLNKTKSIDLSEFTMTGVKLCVNPEYFTCFKIENDRNSFQPIKKLIGKFQESPRISHPGRMYGCYDYDWKRNAWIKNKNHPMYKEIKNDTSK